MTGNETRTFYCLVQGDSTAFKVISEYGDVSDLKGLIWQAAFYTARETVLAKDLVLWKLHEPEPLKPHDTLAQRIKSRGTDLAKFAERLDVEDAVFEIFPRQVPERHLHILVQCLPARGHKRGREHLSDDDDEAKRFKLAILNAPVSRITEFYKHIQMCPADPAYYSDSSLVTQLPIPFLSTIPLCFNAEVKDEIAYMPYMGREKFAAVWDAWFRLKDDRFAPQAIYVYGTSGYGKSHILAALACLLIRKGHRVVYIPDCRHGANNPFKVLQLAFVLAFGDPQSTELLGRISRCETFEQLQAFCQEYGVGKQITFIVDQINALDWEPDGRDNISQRSKQQFQEWLQLLWDGHIKVTSASPNHQTAKHMAAKQTGDYKIALMGGMMPTEMSHWWRRREEHCSAFSKTDKQRIEDLTGCIPLLLTPFLRNPCGSLESLEPEIWSDPELSAVPADIHKFALHYGGLKHTHMFRQGYLDIMESCLKNSDVDGDELLMDHCYFYVDERRVGRYTCGLARQAMIGLLRVHGQPHTFLGGEWYETLAAFKHNPSVTGFLMQEIIVDKISAVGLRAVGIPSSPIKPYTSSTPVISSDTSALYVPVKFNERAIDAVFIDIIHPKRAMKAKASAQAESSALGRLAAKVTAIQITMAEWHSDSESKFFTKWAEWQTKLDKFGELEVTFLWIIEKKREVKPVEERMRTLRNRYVLIDPSYTSRVISLDQVDLELGGKWAKIRQ